MYYAPHRLQEKIEPVVVLDDLGHPFMSGDTDVWRDVCKCRCDTTSIADATSDNGEAFRPSYHIVCDGRGLLASGATIRVLDEKGAVKCEGKARSVRETNYLNYTDILV